MRKFFTNLINKLINNKYFNVLNGEIQKVDTKLFDYRKIFYKSYNTTFIFILLFNFLITLSNFLFFLIHDKESMPLYRFSFLVEYFCMYEFFFFTFFTLVLFFFFFRIDYQDKRITKNQYEQIFFEIVDSFFVSFILYSFVTIILFGVAFMIANEPIINELFIRILVNLRIIPDESCFYDPFDPNVLVSYYFVTRRKFIKIFFHLLALNILYTYFYSIKFLDEYLINYNIILKIFIYLIVHCMYFCCFSFIHL